MTQTIPATPPKPIFITPKPISATSSLFLSPSLTPLSSSVTPSPPLTPPKPIFVTPKPHFCHPKPHLCHPQPIPASFCDHLWNSPAHLSPLHLPNPSLSPQNPSPPHSLWIPPPCTGSSSLDHPLEASRPSSTGRTEEKGSRRAPQSEQGHGDQAGRVPRLSSRDLGEPGGAPGSPCR